jgi:cell division protease FtsH
MNDDKEPQGINPMMKSLLIWAGILLLIGVFVSVFDTKSRDAKTDGIAYSEFLSKVEEGSVKEIVQR